MNKLKSILGYTWAFIAFFIVLATFFGNERFSKVLASVTGMKVSPWYTGGEVISVIDHGTYRTLVHRPVFDALIGEKREGFIQINWEPSAGIPQVIEEKIDYDKDRKEDLLIILDTSTGKTTLTAYSPLIVSIERIYRLKNGWAVRIAIRKPS
jgi:hypothetical protein